MRWPAPLLLVALLAATTARAADPPAAPLADRGYYLTFTRMPTYGHQAWRRALDGFRDDGCNLLIMWVAGGFRSRKFPETWDYNRDHANVRADFLRALIDDAHARGIRVLLGFTPFGYDGVNRMSLARPEWRATGPDGQPVRRFGIHSWGYNLCPARADTQQFMLDYARELAFDFYPNADGLFIESSDYAACHCPRCGDRFFQHEHRFVRTISEELWRRSPRAAVVVYPHYFSGARVPGLDVTADRQPFDPRWSLFFTPHSAPPAPDLIRQATRSLWWDDAPARGTPARVRAGARRARETGCAGYVPSLEAFSFVATEPEEGQSYLVSRRQVPFGFGWLADGQLPYDELPARVNRVAFREYTRDPDLPDVALRAALGQALFGTAATPQAVDDALFLQQLFFAERTWCQPAPLANSQRVRALHLAGQLPAERRAAYRTQLLKVCEIEARYRDRGEPFAAVYRPARWLSRQWTGENALLLAP